jgi:hypothetical protein
MRHAHAGHFLFHLGRKEHDSYLWAGLAIGIVLAAVLFFTVPVPHHTYTFAQLAAWQLR